MLAPTQVAKKVCQILADQALSRRCGLITPRKPAVLYYKLYRGTWAGKKKCENDLEGKIPGTCGKETGGVCIIYILERFNFLVTNPVQCPVNVKLGDARFTQEIILRGGSCTEISIIERGLP